MHTRLREGRSNPAAPTRACVFPAHSTAGRAGSLCQPRRGYLHGRRAVVALPEVALITRADLLIVLQHAHAHAPHQPRLHVLHVAAAAREGRARLEDDGLLWCGSGGCLSSAAGCGPALEDGAGGARLQLLLRRQLCLVAVAPAHHMHQLRDEVCHGHAELKLLLHTALLLSEWAGHSAGPLLPSLLHTTAELVHERSDAQVALHQHKQQLPRDLQQARLSDSNCDSSGPAGSNRDLSAHPHLPAQILHG